MLLEEVNGKKQQKRMKVKEAAEYLSLNPSTVYRTLSAHKIPGIRIKGAGWRIDREKLDKMLDEEMEERERR